MKRREIMPHEMRHAMNELLPLRGSRFYSSSVGVVQGVAKREGSAKAWERARAIREEYENLILEGKVA